MLLVLVTFERRSQSSRVRLMQVWAGGRFLCRRSLTLSRAAAGACWPRLAIAGGRWRNLRWRPFVVGNCLWPSVASGRQHPRSGGPSCGGHQRRQSPLWPVTPAIASGRQPWPAISDLPASDASSSDRYIRFHPVAFEFDLVRFNSISDFTSAFSWSSIKGNKTSQRSPATPLGRQRQQSQQERGHLASSFTSSCPSQTI